MDGLGNPVAFLLSPGNENDSTHAIELMSMTDIAGSNLLGDKAYGTKEILAYIRECCYYDLVTLNNSPDFSNKA